VNFWVNTWLASSMAEGSISAISYGFALMLMAQAVIAQSIATAAMPTFATQYALGKMDEIRGSLAATLRGVLLLSLPAAIGLILLRFPIVGLLYNFNAGDKQLVAWALLWYATGLVGHSVLEILARTFYAMHDTKTPVLVGTVAMGLNLVFSFLFSAWFARIGWMPHGGLALANSLATALEALTLLVLMRYRLQGLNGAAITKGLGAAVLGSLGMIAALAVWMKAAPSASNALTALVGIAIGGIAYGLILVLLRIHEVKSLFLFLKRRVTKTP
jgi:putative peptidoglycan lipid II flippase